MIGRVLGHYRIEEKVGAGGMGEVYRAYDEHLDRYIALKVLAPAAFTDAAARKRFRKEAQVISRLNHPNIATVYDFDSYEGIDFLAMELIPGVSLESAVLSGPLKQNEVLDLGTQLGTALVAAHAHGVVHRDFKPGNLIVTPEGRLKVLDFGLATLFEPPVDQNMTRSVAEMESISGTLPYMSPEQLRGEPSDPRSDIYATGAVLYELATGKCPFPDLQGAELIGAILHLTPLPPRHRNQKITRALDGIIMKALAKDPAQRYQTAQELLTALEALRGMESRTAGQATGIRRLWMTGIASLVLLLAGIFALNVSNLRHRVLAGKSAFSAFHSNMKSRPSVAVLGFKNLSERADKAWLSTALEEMLTTELAAGEQLRLIPGENVAQMKASLSLPEAETYSTTTLNRIRDNIGSDNVLVGSYLAVGNEQVRVDVRLQNAISGETLASVADSGSEDEISDLAVRIGERLRGKLGAASLQTEETRAMRAALPSSSEVIRLYSEGLAKLRVFDAVDARDFLEKAVKLDPKYAPAHAELAGAWTVLGYDAKAKDAAKIAFELSANLSREDRLTIEGRYRETIGEWDKAIRIYQTLWDFFPDNLDYGLRLVSAQINSGKGQDALAIVDKMRSLPPPTNEDPRISQAEANAAELLGDFKRQQSAAAAAVERARQKGAKLLEARALYSQGWALQNLGESKDAMRVADESKSIYSATGDQPGVARVLHLIGTILLKDGDVTGAFGAYQDALSVSRETGSKGGMSVALNNLANILLIHGDLSGAGKQFEQARLLFHEIGDVDYEAFALSNVAEVLTLQGALRKSQAAADKALTMFLASGDKDGQAYALVAKGSALAQQGELATAEKAYKEALALSHETSDRSIEGHALHGLAAISLQRAAFADAKKQSIASLKIRQEIGEKASAAETQMLLTEISLEGEQPQDAEKTARSAMQEFQAQGLADDEYMACAVLVRMLVAQGRIAEAQNEVDRLTNLVRGRQNPETRLKFRIAAAELHGADVRNSAAEKSLQAVLTEAAKLGLKRYELEAKLALGKMKMKTESVAGRSQLIALQRDAAAKGFMNIARKAEAARQ
jgi:eukaryotic-like serine/threonine-protein kinase